MSAIDQKVVVRAGKGKAKAVALKAGKKADLTFDI